MSTAAGHLAQGPDGSKADTGWLRPFGIPAVLIAVGALLFALGLLVYAADRGASHPQLASWAVWLGVGPLFGAWGAWLPSFVHPFAFSVFSAAIHPASEAPAYRACAAWWAVNVAFEIGQHPRAGPLIAAGLHRGFGDIASLRQLADFFRRGTFDPADLAAASAGAACAAMLLFLLHRLELRHAC